MSELAFNANGESFEIPASVTGWRVRRMKPRGAPELVYGRDGRPLTLPIESDMTELRDAVGTVGRYRLDPINDDGRTVDNVPAAYVQVVKTEPAGPTPMMVASSCTSDETIREALRANTELARIVIDKFPAMMTSAADPLRAADGAGLPARPPRLVEPDDDDDDDGDEVVPATGTIDINAILAQIIPVLMSLFGGGAKLPGVAAMFDWRKAAPKADRSHVSLPAAATQSSASPAVESSASPMPPAIDAATMAHFIAVQAALSPDEGALARELAAELSPLELRAWIDELSKLSVPEAAAKIRTVIAGANVGVS